MHDKIKNITPGIVGLPTPKNPNLNTHANMEMSITPLIPKRRRKNGINKMQSASLTCESDVSKVALLAAKDIDTRESALPLKLVMKGPAKLFVTCRDMPSNAEKIKNRAIRFVLKSLKALKPSVSENVAVFFFSNLHSGKVRQ